MGLTYGQTKDALCAAITAALPADEAENAYVWVCDFSDSYVVYEVGGGSYLQDNYTILDGEITLAGEAEPVKAVTTYEPLGLSGRIEVRGRSSEGRYQEMLSRTPGVIAAQVTEALAKLKPEETSSELVYSPFGQHSYYRDFIEEARGRATVAAMERLNRHAEQMDSIAKRRTFRDSGLEFRVTPDRTDGYGGYLSPPAWLNQLFATANRPGRVLAGLMPRFDLPVGASSVNLPLINTGTVNQPAQDDSAVPAQDITDQPGSSNVAPLAGQADVALQLLEQSPQGAHLDWVIFQDLGEAYDFDLEQQLLYGDGLGLSHLMGVTNVNGIISVPYTDSTPTGSEMWVPLGKVPAQIGDARLRPPECWLMRTARWFWLQGSEDTATRPFGLSTAFYLGSDDNTPDPIGGMMGLPVFLNDAIPANLGTAANQDEIICLRPRDMILLEGQPQTLVAREPLSGSLGVRLQMHCNVAAITDRRPAGTGVLSGTGLVVQSGY